MGRQAPYPKSSYIVNLIWSSQIRRTGLGPIVNPETLGRDGSDNWPITWADDDHLYVTYGDGYGFEPYLKEKRGLVRTHLWSPRVSRRSQHSLPERRECRVWAQGKKGQRPADGRRRALLVAFSRRRAGRPGAVGRLGGSREERVIVDWKERR